MLLRNYFRYRKSLNINVAYQLLLRNLKIFTILQGISFSDTSMQLKYFKWNALYNFEYSYSIVNWLSGSGLFLQLGSAVIELFNCLGKI